MNKGRGRGGGASNKPTNQLNSTNALQIVGKKHSTEDAAIVSRGRDDSQSLNQHLIPKQMQGAMRQQGEFRKIKPADNYDVISMARAMNADFAPKLKKLFDPETDAAQQAIQTGVYIGWRCPEFKHDCQRLGINSKCFCGHLLMEHDKFTANSAQVKCAQEGCACRAFQWIPQRPEDVGEFWLQRRPGFDPTTWRAKCRCKHTHEEHRPDSLKCRIKGCSCFRFDSNFLCAACDKHWEQHSTFFESTQTRRANGLPIGEDYIPFAEIPQLRDIAMSGKEATEEEYKAISAMFSGPGNTGPPPPPKALQGGTRMGGRAIQGMSETERGGPNFGGSGMRGGPGTGGQPEGRDKFPSFGGPRY